VVTPVWVYVVLDHRFRAYHAEISDPYH